jgi:tripartite-type tricarboxylate transporter receptor subunit TctC
VVIENRPGAGGTIGAAQVAKAEPDGYTLLVHSSGHVVNAAIYPQLPYDTLADFAGVTPLASLPNVLVVSPARGWKNVAELVAAARAKPGQLNYASAGNGSATHMNAEKFRLQTGIVAEHVAYKGTPEALTEIMAGRVDWFFAPLASALPLIKDGKLQALAVSTARRSPALPDVPTTIEAGVPDSDYTFWVALFAPAKTPRAAVAKLADAVAAAQKTPEVRDRYARLGAEPLWLAPEAFDAQLKAEMESSAKLVKAANLKAP